MQKKEITKDYLFDAYTGHGNDHYADLLSRLPTVAADDLDRFILSFLNTLLDNNRGSGFLSIQAEQKLQAMKMMGYDELRAIAQISPDYHDFVLISEEIRAKARAHRQDMQHEMRTGSDLEI